MTLLSRDRENPESQAGASGPSLLRYQLSLRETLDSFKLGIVHIVYYKKSLR